MVDKPGDARIGSILHQMANLENQIEEECVFAVGLGKIFGQGFAGRGGEQEWSVYYPGEWDAI